MQRKDRVLPSAKYATNQGMRQETMVRYSQRTFGSSLLSMRLHGDVGIEMVQSAVGLFATVPATLVHALNLLVSSSRTLMLLRSGDGHERVNLWKIKFALANARCSFIICPSQVLFFSARVSRRIVCFFFSPSCFSCSRVCKLARARLHLNVAPRSQPHHLIFNDEGGQEFLSHPLPSLTL